MSTLLFGKCITDLMTNIWAFLAACDVKFILPIVCVQSLANCQMVPTFYVILCEAVFQIHLNQISLLIVLPTGSHVEQNLTISAPNNGCISKPFFSDTTTITLTHYACKEDPVGLKKLFLNMS